MYIYTQIKGMSFAVRGIFLDTLQARNMVLESECYLMCNREFLQGSAAKQPETLALLGIKGPPETPHVSR